MNRNFFIWLTIVHLLGTLVAWIHNIQQFIKYYNYEGTLALVAQPVIPHPVTTPCFWGGFGFIFALIIAVMFARKRPAKKNVGWYSLFLLGGTLFAWNFAGRDLYKFFTPSSSGEQIIGCSGMVITNPFLTACFAGAALFLIAFLISLGAYSKK